MITASSNGAWQELDAKLRPFVSRRIRNESDVDDIVQEVFLRIQKGLVDLRDDDRFGPWVYQIARSAIIDHQRRAAKHRVVDADPPEQPIEDETNDNEVSEELASYLAPFVAMMPSPYREAITLTELEGVTQKEAAEMLGVSLSAMKSRVQRGRQLLRQHLELCCHIALDARGKVVSCEPRADYKPPKGCCT